VFILTRNRACLNDTFFTKKCNNLIKIWNKLAIKMYTRLVRANICCCDRNGALSIDIFCELYVASFYFCSFHQKFQAIPFLLLVELFSRLSLKLSIFDLICINSFMLIFDHRICPESLSVEFGYTLYI
jgi:hypothetical protein